jgi:hypothetical protein
MIGFYGGFAEADKDYPAVEGWPTGFVSVPIHTVETSREFVVNYFCTQSSKCFLVWSLVDLQVCE